MLPSYTAVSDWEIVLYALQPLKPWTSKTVRVHKIFLGVGSSYPNMNDMKFELPSYQESVEEFKEREAGILRKLAQEAEDMSK